MIQLCLHHKVTHEETRLCLEHLWLLSGFKEQHEVRQAERETTSENEGNNCFCTKPESHARLYKSIYCQRAGNHNK